jgi:hypothetical protein
MGILADLVVAKPSDTLKYDGQRGPLFEVAEYKGLTNLEFETLWAITQNVEYNPETHSLESLIPESETWLFSFPEPYLSLLAKLTPDEMNQAAKAWSKTEELMCEPSEALAIIRDAVRLANLATSQAKGLFLWGSL